MNKRDLQAENDALREALMEAYNSIEAALAVLDGDAAETHDEDEEEDTDE